MIYLIIYFVWKKRLEIRIHIESVAMLNVFTSWSGAWKEKYWKIGDKI